MQNLRLFLLVVCSFTMFACSSGDNDDDAIARVTEIILSDSTLAAGNEAELDVNFSFSTEAVFDDDENVIVAIKLPRGIRYVTGSGRVNSIGEDDDVTGVRFSCSSDQGQLVVFDLDEQDLRGARDPGGPADAKLKMEIEAIQPGVGTGTIEARADYDRAYAACDPGFFGQDIALITVFP